MWASVLTWTRVSLSTPPTTILCFVRRSSFPIPVKGQEIFSFHFWQAKHLTDTICENRLVILSINSLHLRRSLRVREVAPHLSVFKIFCSHFSLPLHSVNLTQFEENQNNSKGLELTKLNFHFWVCDIVHFVAFALRNIDFKLFGQMTYFRWNTALPRLLTATETNCGRCWKHLSLCMHI